MNIEDLMDVQDIEIGQKALMRYDPRDGSPKPYPSHAKQFRKWHGRDAWLYNPWTGEARHYSNIGTDVTGVAIAVDKILSGEKK